MSWQRAGRGARLAGSLGAGVSPFTVNYALTEQLYLPTCEVDVDIDTDEDVPVNSGYVFVSEAYSPAHRSR